MPQARALRACGIAGYVALVLWGLVQVGPTRDSFKIEFPYGPNGGLLVLPDNFINAHRELIVTLAAKYRLPAIYPFGFLSVAAACCVMALT